MATMVPTNASYFQALRIAKQEKRKRIENHLDSLKNGELQKIVDTYYHDHNIFMHPFVWARDLLMDPDEHFEYCKAHEIINTRQKQQEKPKDTPNKRWYEVVHDMLFSEPEY